MQAGDAGEKAIGTASSVDEALESLDGRGWRGAGGQHEAAVGGGTRLWRLHAGHWSVISPSPFISAFGSSWRVSVATITFDAQGVLYAAAERMDMNDSTPFSWFAGLSKEVIVLMSADMGQTFQVYPISTVDPTRPHWLTNIERPTTTAFASVHRRSPQPERIRRFVPLYKH